MTPDANTLCVFAVKRGDLGQRFDINYSLPKYTDLVSALYKKFGDKVKKVSEIADVVCGPFGSSIKNTDYQESGIPLIRISNITKDGYMDYDDLVFISENLGTRLAGTQVSAGDIVVSQRGSLGQCAVVDNAYPKMNISANIIAIKNIHGVSTPFLHDYLLSTIGQTLLERNISGQVQPKITTQDIANLLIPVGADEKMLAALTASAYASYQSKLRQADALVEEAKENVFKELGVVFKEYRSSIYSRSTLKQIREIGLFCNPHSAYLEDVFSALKSSPLYVGELGHYVEVNPAMDRSALTDETEVSFVPMTNVYAKENRADYIVCTYEKVKTGFTPFRKDDLLWAKITPCMQNGKSFLASDMPTEYGFGSTEFHVLRAENNQVYMPFLWILLSENHILEAAQGMFSGSAGQQRVPDLFLKKFPLILPAYKKQKELSDIVLSAHKNAYAMRQAAEQEWTAAKAQFEEALLQG